MSLHPASVLVREVENADPTTYARIVDLLKPYSMESLATVLADHLDHSPIDLNAINENRHRISGFLFEYARKIRKNFPSAGDPHGISMTCRLTSDDTQSALDSRHLKRSLRDEESAAKRPKRSRRNDHFWQGLRYEIDLYSNQSRFLEIACKRKFSSVYLRDPCNATRLASAFRHEYSVVSSSGPPFQTTNGCCPTLARFLVIPGTPAASPDEGDEGRVATRVLYHRHHSRDLAYLLSHFPLDAFEAFNDLRQVYEKCGPTCYYFNAVRIAGKHFGRDSKDLALAIKMQICTGRLLPLNREGLARNTGRNPLEVIVFEAMRKNSVLLASRPNEGCSKVRYSSTSSSSSSSSSSSPSEDDGEEEDEEREEEDEEREERKIRYPSYAYDATRRSTDRMVAGLAPIDGTGYFSELRPDAAV